MDPMLMVVTMIVSLILIGIILLYFHEDKKRAQEFKSYIEEMKKSMREEICENLGLNLSESETDALPSEVLQTNAKASNSGPDYCLEGFEYDLTSFKSVVHGIGFLTIDEKESL